MRLVESFGLSRARIGRRVDGACRGVRWRRVGSVAGGGGRGCLRGCLRRCLRRVALDALANRVMNRADEISPRFLRTLAQ